MDLFDNIIPLLFVAIWILSVIFGKKKKKKENKPPKKDSPLRGVIGKMIQQMKEELEQKSADNNEDNE